MSINQHIPNYSSPAWVLTLLWQLGLLSNLYAYGGQKLRGVLNLMDWFIPHVKKTTVESGTLPADGNSKLKSPDL